MINVEVEKTNNESNANLIRRFTKRVQGSGVLPRVRGLRYSERVASPYVKKKRTLKKLRERTEREKLIKLGKLAEKRTR
jgi:hypothetical protein